MNQSDWQRLCVDLFSLLDGIEEALVDDDRGRLNTLIFGRFEIIESYGIKRHITGIQNKTGVQ